MRERPDDVTDDEVRTAVAEHWADEGSAAAPVDRLDHLPVGFGAHHWAAYRRGDDQPAWFVTFDRYRARHTPESLEAAYATAAALHADGLEFVLAPVPGRDGRFTRPVRYGAVSVTPWRVGTSGEGTLGPVDGADAAEVLARTAAMVARLHAATPPEGVPTWRPLVPAGLPEALAVRVRTPWEAGPYAEPARQAVGEHLDAIFRWVERYHALAERAGWSPWVVTHGEPHTANQLTTTDGVLLVDWESVKLAPRERDLKTLLDWAGARPEILPEPDWPMVEMFDLEWRLDEIAQYVDWFAAPHTGSASDRVAFDGLLEELRRPEWRPPW